MNDEGGAVVVGTHGGEGEVAEEGVGVLLTHGPIARRELQKVRDGGWDAGVVEGVVDDGAGGDPGRDEDGGDADAEAIEGEGVEGSCVGGLGDEGGIGRAGGRRYVVVDAAVLVVDDEQRRVRPERGVGADGVVDSRDELLAGAHIVVGMLIVGDLFAAAVGCWVVGVVGLDEAVVGEGVLLAGGEEVGEGAEEGGLILEEVDDLHGGTCLVEVEELAGVVGGKRANVDGRDVLAFVKDVHADLAEGGSVVSEGAVADGGAGDGREPAIKDGVLRCERGEDGEFVGREVVEDVVGVRGVLLLIEVAGDEALHGCRQRRSVLGAVEDLEVDGGEVVVGVGVELALVLGERLDFDGSAGGVGVGLGAGEAVDVGKFFLERAEHVVEGAVLHHEHDDMLEVLNSGQGSVKCHCMLRGAKSTVIWGAGGKEALAQGIRTSEVWRERFAGPVERGRGIYRSELQRV